MTGKVWVRKWDDSLELLEAIEVGVAENGVVDLLCVDARGRQERRAWWRWKSEGATSLYGYIDELATLPGWSPALREIIFSNLEARREGRMRRWTAQAMGEGSQGKGSAFRS
jgi:hypothetical protein